MNSSLFEAMFYVFQTNRLLFRRLYYMFMDNLNGPKFYSIGLHINFKNFSMCKSLILTF